MLTGWDCPGCGGLRAVNDLAHGRVDQAFHSNALFVSAIPLLVLGWVWWAQRAWSGDRSAAPWARLTPVVRRSLLAAAAALILAFTVWRNTPWGAAFHVA